MLDPVYSALMLVVDLYPKDARPVVETTTRPQTQSRSLDGSQRSDVTLTAADQMTSTAATAPLPTEGIVPEKAVAATKRKTTDIDKVRPICDWTIVNTFRNVDTKGCGVGDVKAALETDNFDDKCADDDAIFVALCRSLGIPARDIFGIRITVSTFGDKEPGIGRTNIKRAQHCRAEALPAVDGWVPMDPADVGKVQRVETADWIKTTDRPVVAPRYKARFGSCEGNWQTYNVAHDVTLQAQSPKLPFLMHPQAETTGGRLDPYDPANFKYTITAKAIKAYGSVRCSSR